jgi:LysM repeat protein
MKKHISLFLAGILLLLAVTLLRSAFPVSASLEPQVYYYTPTAQADGRIIYTVKENDTCISISLLNGITQDQLQLLNNIQGDGCLYLNVGQQLLLGTVAPEPTVGIQPTATSVLPSPTPFNGTGELCVLLFNDINGNALIDDETVELPLGGGALSVNDTNGRVALNQQTSAEGENCFPDLPEGTYTISIAVPEGYNATMQTTAKVVLTAGDTTSVDFGAQISAAGEAIQDDPAVSSRSPFLGIMGGLVLLFGLGFGIYALRLQKK